MSADQVVMEQSQRIVDFMCSDDEGLHKQAAQELTDYTRTHNREGSLCGAIIEPSEFRQDMLQKEMHTDQPLMLFEYEQTSPFSAPVDFGATPQDFIPRGRRYPVVFQQVQTDNVVCNLLELQTYGQDIRAIMGDNATKDMIAKRDHVFFNKCKQIMQGKNVVLPWAGKAMHVDTNSPLSYSAFTRGKNTMRNTPFSIEPVRCVMNNLRIADLEVSAVEELQGTDVATDIAFNGWAKRKYADLQILFTIKRKLIPTSHCFLFGDQDFLGRYINWIEPKMVIKKEAMIVQFYVYEVYGMTIAHPGALAINEFLG